MNLVHLQRTVVIDILDQTTACFTSTQGLWSFALDPLRWSPKALSWLRCPKLRQGFFWTNWSTGGSTSNLIQVELRFVGCLRYVFDESHRWSPWSFSGIWRFSACQCAISLQTRLGRHHCGTGSTAETDSGYSSRTWRWVEWKHEMLGLWLHGSFNIDYTESTPKAVSMPFPDGFHVCVLPRWSKSHQARSFWTKCIKCHWSRASLGFMGFCLSFVFFPPSKSFQAVGDNSMSFNF